MSTKSEVYFGSWEDYAGMLHDFSEHHYEPAGKYADVPIENFPSPDEIRFASYDTRDYEGDAVVIFAKDGKLWEVTGGHCSCTGLEGQWSPGEITLDYLQKTVSNPDSYYRAKHHSEDAVQALHDLVQALGVGDGK